MSRPTLESARLWLNPAGPADAQALHSLWNEPEVRKYLWDDQPVPLERVQQVIDAANADFRQRGFGLWNVTLRQSGVVAGFCALREFEKGRVEVIFGLRPGFGGKGYAVEAARLVLAHGFGPCGLETTWGRADEPNTASVRVLGHLGMKPRGRATGPRFPILEFAVTREEFATLPAFKPALPED